MSTPDLIHPQPDRAAYTEELPPTASPWLPDKSTSEGQAIDRRHRLHECPEAAAQPLSGQNSAPSSRRTALAQGKLDAYWEWQIQQV